MLIDVKKEWEKIIGPFASERLTGGFSHHTFLVTQASRQYVLKIEKGSGGYLRREYEVLEQLRGASFLPDPAGFLEAEGYFSFMQSYHRGENVSKLASHSSFWLEAYKSLAVMLASEVHSRKGSIREYDRNAEPLQWNIDALPLRAMHHQAVEVWKARTSTGITFVHGDAGPHNMILNENHRAVLIDWEWAGWNDPMIDISWVLWNAAFHAPERYSELRRAFLETYVSIRTMNITETNIKAYSLAVIYRALGRVRRSPEAIQNRWVKRLDWTLNSNWEKGEPL
ncbi:aminoglycoside phosphotransferase family protein [Marinococcus sp. PL1-022]|uniref:phosphotransferase family protein n=1 Tax=Marinococcus sp. PL1-022 TaxID=3095363 RepID=UPI0029C33C92|nr:aminoglycoside phosphotransferase family protein [Marinococcus sp. PL1-022]MDX6153661.1 aminoglycoside phosphotransferase family protein [Marinococcus sp. PL1-022]